MKILFNHLARGVLLPVLFISSIIGCTVIDPSISRIFISAVNNVSVGNTIGLYGAKSTTTAKVGNTTYLFVGYSNNGVSVFSVGKDGSLANITNVKDDDTLLLNGVNSIATAVVNETTYLFVAGFHDNGVSVFSVGKDGSLVNITNVKDDDTLLLEGTWKIVTVNVEGDAYLFVTSGKDKGISIFSVDAGGSLINVDNVKSDSYYVDGEATTAKIDGKAYFFTIEYWGDGVSIFSMGDGGSLANITNVKDDDTLLLNGANSVATAVVNGTTYLFVAGFHDNGVSVFSVDGKGSLEHATNVEDDDTLSLGEVQSITTAVVGGNTYLFVIVGDRSDGVSVFSVDSK